MLVPFCRTLILYVLIVVAIRLMGKRQVGEMQPTELVITILVSAVASVPMQDLDIPLLHGAVPVLTLIAAEVLISALALKIPTFRKILTGKPVPVVENGVIDQKALKKMRFSLDDLLEDLRLNNVFDLKTVRFAQIETNGQLSVLVQTLDSPTTPRQMSLSPKGENPYFVIVGDGKLFPDNLKKVQKDNSWLDGVMHANGASCVSEVFLLCADVQSNVIFSKR